VHDTTSIGLNMSDDPKPVPPLRARKADGTPYTRFADVEAEIRDIWCRPPMDWIALKEKLKSETLAFLIKKSGQKDDYIRGELLFELKARTLRITESEVNGFDEVIREEIGLEVDGKMFGLLWSEAHSSQAEYLEISFSDKVRDLTRNAIDRYKGSVMAERDQLDVWTENDAGEGAFAVVELRRDVLDLRRDQEEMLILMEDDSRQDELLHKISHIPKDPRHFQALYLFHAEDKSLAEIAAQFQARVRTIREWKDTAMHEIRFALGIETEDKLKAIRKRRRDRRAKRTVDSAQPKRNYRRSESRNNRPRPGSQPPSLFI
jgi:DNA-directed RNA polymerase specialized sigma24 family protein